MAEGSDRASTVAWKLTLEYQSDDRTTRSDVRIETTGDWTEGDDAVDPGYDIVWDLGTLLNMLIASGHLLGSNDIESLTEHFQNVFR